MPSVFKALKNMFREKSDQAAKAISNPVVDAKWNIVDAKKQIGDFERKVAQLMATNNTAKKNMDGAKEESKKWKGLATRAAEAGNEADVTSAITKKQAADGQVKTFKDEIARNDGIIVDLRAQLAKARTKIAKAESNKAQLSARLEGAKVRKELNAASSSFGDGGPLAALDDLEEAVVSAESEADAYDELRSDAGEDLEEKYGSGDANVDDEVAALMAKAAKKG